LRINLSALFVSNEPKWRNLILPALPINTISGVPLVWYVFIVSGTWCPKDTTIETLVSVEGRRWAIEDSFETAKNKLGLDHNETRSWHGWHRHLSLVMLAFAMMATIRHHANAAPPPKTIRMAHAKIHR
jgi:SRSO17 transposase